MNTLSLGIFINIDLLYERLAKLNCRWTLNDGIMFLLIMLYLKRGIGFYLIFK